MKRFQNVLCFVDAWAENQRALHRAAKLAGRNSASLKIVDVIDDTSNWLGMLLKSHAGDLEQQRQNQLQGLAESVRSQVETVTFELLHGRPALAVVREVLRHGFDLVMKDARGTSTHKTLLVGSIDMRLLRNCPCPVWLSAPDRGIAHNVILAAVDPLANDPEHKGMNRMILELATSLAVIYSAELHVISAWEAPGENMLAGRVTHERLLSYIAESHDAAKQGLTKAIGPIRPSIDRRHVRLQKGEPADVILSHASEIQCDLLIMGTIARRIPGLLMGNTADTVLRQIECSVMTVKLEGFVSPVKAD